MKNFIILLLSVVSLSCSVKNKKQTNNPKIDSQLIGAWSGYENNLEIEGMEKYWIQQRNADGTFVLLFVTSEDCEMKSMTDSGQWWVKDGRFYEKHSSSGLTDIYKYTVLDENHVGFTMIRSAIDPSLNNKYKFIDTRVGE